MILIEFLFAPTVPSEPRPKNTQLTRLSGSIMKEVIDIEAGVGNIIVDADGEMILGFGFLQFIQHGFDHGWSEFLGGKTIAAADDFDIRPVTFNQCIDDIQVERLTHVHRVPWCGQARRCDFTLLRAVP